MRGQTDVWVWFIFIEGRRMSINPLRWLNEWGGACNRLAYWQCLVALCWCGVARLNLNPQPHTLHTHYSSWGDCCLLVLLLNPWPSWLRLVTQVLFPMPRPVCGKLDQRVKMWMNRIPKLASFVPSKVSEFCRQQTAKGKGKQTFSIATFESFPAFCWHLFPELRSHAEKFPATLNVSLLASHAIISGPVHAPAIYWLQHHPVRPLRS